MKIIIIVCDEGEWAQDTIEARMVDTRIDQMLTEFAFNKVPVQVIRYDGLPPEWVQPTVKRDSRFPIWNVWYISPDDGKKYFMMVQAPDEESAKQRFKETRWKGEVEPIMVTRG